VEVAHRYLEHERLKDRGSSFARIPTHAMRLHERGTQSICSDSYTGHPPLKITGNYTISGGTCEDKGTAVLSVSPWDY
jgi:hypothetical protein